MWWHYSWTFRNKISPLCVYVCWLSRVIWLLSDWSVIWVTMWHHHPRTLPVQIPNSVLLEKRLKKKKKRQVNVLPRWQSQQFRKCMRCIRQRALVQVGQIISQAEHCTRMGPCFTWWRHFRLNWWLHPPNREHYSHGLWLTSGPVKQWLIRGPSISLLSASGGMEDNPRYVWGRVMKARIILSDKTQTNNGRPTSL